MEYISTRLLVSKVTAAQLYLHSVFILVVITAMPVFQAVYSNKYIFKWSVDYGPLPLCFYTVLLLFIYFTAFVVLRNRPELKKGFAFFVKIVGLACVFFLFIGFRWLTEQQLAFWLFGLTNYPKDTSFAFFFHDNLLYSVIMILASFFLKFMNDWFINDRIKSALEKQNLRLELDFLKSQVNPHFLFNTLNNIQSYIVQDEKMKSIELIGRLSEFMRFALYECNEEYIDLDKEISMLNDYVELERVRCDDRVNISFETSGDFDNFKIPPLLLMPFVENAFKHGADMQVKESWINISIKEYNAQLHLQVENNFAASALLDERKGGIGLQNVNKRLMHYFANKQQLDINTDGNVYKVSLDLQLD